MVIYAAMLETTRLRKDNTTVIFETDIAYSIEFAASTLNFITLVHIEKRDIISHMATVRLYIYMNKHII